MPCITKNQAFKRMNTLYKTGAIDWVNLQPKINEAKQIITESINKSDNPVVAFSGGKDSIVVLDLVRSINPIYDLGIRRCGCRFCTAYLSWKDMTSLYNIKDTKLLLKKLGQDNLDRWSNQ